MLLRGSRGQIWLGLSSTSRLSCCLGCLGGEADQGRSICVGGVCEFVGCFGMAM